MSPFEPKSRKRVIAALRQLGLHEIREGGKHTIWGSDRPIIRVPVPRHSEISGFTVKSIADELGPLGQRFKNLLYHPERTE